MTMAKLVFNKGRYNAVNVNAQMDLDGETISSQIRVGPDETSDLILTWTVTETDYSVGTFVLSYNDSTPDADIAAVTRGFMDIKRLTGSGDISLMDEPLVVEFRSFPTP
jgi:hypothetical protein